MKRLSTLLLALFIAIIARGPAACSLQHNAEGAEPTVNIVLGEKATLPEKIAGRELAGYLGKLYPSTRFKVADQKTSSGMAIRIGTPESAPELLEYLGDKKLQGPESYVVAKATIDGRPTGLIVGADPAGVVYGVYGLLRQLSCGFYLSFDAIPKAKSGTFRLDEWNMADRPLVFDRIVFNWHNFLSGCSSWNLEHWEHWITQSQKAGYNAVMVHAYGNNPMAGFVFDHMQKPVGYLSSTRVGRDWSTMHVNDVRRLYGGEVFDEPVFGSSASVAGDDRLRTEAAQKLMRAAFQHAEDRGVKIYFTVDVDTISANPQPLIKSLPESARFAISSGKGQKPPQVWLANPDTPEGYRYYKAQVENLIKTYPQIDCLVVWFRNQKTLWRRIEIAEMPVTWRQQYKAAVERNPAVGKLPYSRSMFAISKIVTAFDRAARELDRTDIQVATGTWRFDFFPAADFFMPEGTPLIALDYNVISDNSQLATAKNRAVIAAVGKHRPVFPITWAHHDDGHYLGRPYLPDTTFCTKLNETHSAGFGIIHWTTRPLDVYFDSLSRQTWRSTRDESLEETCRDMAARCFGPANAETLGLYLHKWLTEAPMFSRETGPYFIDPKHKVVDPAKLEPEMKQRLALLESIDTAKLTNEQRDRLNYFKGLERYIIESHRVETLYRKAKENLDAGRMDEARRLISESGPEPVIEHFARFSRLGGISRGEQGTVVTMNTRWLPHILRLRQQLALEPIRINFAPTSHDPLAQEPGRYTFHFGTQHDVWQTLGEKETGSPTFTLSSNVKIGLPNGAPPTWAEISRSGIESAKPVSFTVRPILAGKSTLPAGRYRLTLLMVEPAATKDGQRVFDVTVDTGSSSKRTERVDLLERSGGRNRVVALTYPIELDRSGSVRATLAPVQGKAIICGAVLTPHAD